MTRIIIALLLVLSYYPASPQSNTLDHAPIGVMGDHTHRDGDWMMSVRLMHMKMDQLIDGSSTISPSTVLGSYMISPIDMTSTMTMVGGMYAPNDRLTLMTMVPFIHQSMTLQHRTMGQFKTDSRGLGDLTIMGLIALDTNHHYTRHINLGLSVPIGSISQTDITTGSTPVQLPYPMQLGSGTWDLISGITLAKTVHHHSTGFQFMSRLRTGSNNRGYRLGNRFEMTTWIARQQSQSTSLSLRLAFRSWGDIHGSDDQLHPSMVSTAQPNQGGSSLDIGLGSQFKLSAHHRLAVECLIPIYRQSHSIQLTNTYMIITGWQYSL